MLNNRVGIFLKIMFDGYDFVHSEIGQIFVNPERYPIIKKTTYLPELYDNVEEFLQYCTYEEGYLPKQLMNKYKVGLYSTKQSNDINNPWKDKDFILFNTKMLKGLELVNLEELKFWVCPAFDEQGKCYAIGFRIINPEIVKNSFKWIFTCGNNIIYGKDTVDKNKPCYIVEGFRDYIALKESGYNVIGLGSVIISKIQEEYINTLKDPILLLDNDKFGLEKTLQYKNKYRIATLNSTEKDAWDTYIKMPIKIMEIK